MLCLHRCLYSRDFLPRPETEASTKKALVFTSKANLFPLLNDTEYYLSRHFRDDTLCLGGGLCVNTAYADFALDPHQKGGGSMATWVSSCIPHTFIHYIAMYKYNRTNIQHACFFFFFLLTTVLCLPIGRLLSSGVFSSLLLLLHRRRRRRSFNHTHVQLSQTRHFFFGPKRHATVSASRSKVGPDFARFFLLPFREFIFSPRYRQSRVSHWLSASRRSNKPFRLSKADNDGQTLPPRRRHPIWGFRKNLDTFFYFTGGGWEESRHTVPDVLGYISARTFVPHVPVLTLGRVGNRHRGIGLLTFVARQSAGKNPYWFPTESLLIRYWIPTGHWTVWFVDCFVEVRREIYSVGSLPFCFSAHERGRGGRGCRRGSLPVSGPPTIAYVSANKLMLIHMPMVSSNVTVWVEHEHGWTKRSEPSCTGQWQSNGLEKHTSFVGDFFNWVFLLRMPAQVQVACLFPWKFGRVGQNTNASRIGVDGNISTNCLMENKNVFVFWLKPSLLRIQFLKKV